MTSLRWSCDEHDRANCRNPHGCHCREITALIERAAAPPRVIIKRHVPRPQLTREEAEQMVAMYEAGEKTTVICALYRRNLTTLRKLVMNAKVKRRGIGKPKKGQQEVRA